MKLVHMDLRTLESCKGRDKVEKANQRWIDRLQIHGESTQSRLEKLVCDGG
jgi:hypothetical protein